MILSKAGRMTLLAGLLCLLLMGFAGASYGAVRWDVVQSPTEVINTGRSEVTGSVTLFVEAAGLTGTSQGGDSQIGLIYANGLQIDRNDKGIHLAFSSTFNADPPTIVSVENLTITGRCSGFITINIPPGITVGPGDFIRIEGVRGRIDISDGVVAGTDLFVSLQSINDPAANSFTPDTVRVAKSLPGMTVDVADDNVLLCFPDLGIPPGDDRDPIYHVEIIEGFVRAFVNFDNNYATDRVDSSPVAALLGNPHNATQFEVVLNSIPASVVDIDWPDTVNNLQGPVDATTHRTPSYLTLTGSTTFSGGIATAHYKFNSDNQTGYSDIKLESFDVNPMLILSSTNQTDTGIVRAAAALYPFATESVSGCTMPSTSTSIGSPRFAKMYQSSAGVTSTSNSSTSFDVYANVIRCNCFLLFTYVTKDSFFNTGISIANTTGDSEVFGKNAAPNQSGPITFYFYDSTAGYVGSSQTASVASGNSFVGLLSQVLPSGVTSFSGYVIAQAQFQYCHGYAFIADSGFATIAQGYLANVIPDPAIAGGRNPIDSGRLGAHNQIPAGESLNN